jgi:hypothetical protein
MRRGTWWVAFLALASSVCAGACGGNKGSGGGGFPIVGPPGGGLGDFPDGGSTDAAAAGWPVTKLAIVFSEGGGDLTAPRWIAPASDGSIYVAGPLDTKVTFFGKDRTNVQSFDTSVGAFLLKFDATGQLVWAQGYGSGASEDASSWIPPALTPDGSVIRMGAHGDTPYVERVGADGQQQWLYEITATGTSPVAMAATPEGDAIVVGRGVTADTAGQTIMKLSGTSGAVLWSHATTDPEWIFPSNLAVDSDGSIIVDGHNASTTGFIEGTTQSFLRLTPAGDRGTGSWTHTLATGTLESPWVLAPSSAAAPGSGRIIAVDAESSSPQLDLINVQTGTAVLPSSQVDYPPEVLAATSDTLALLSSDPIDSIERGAVGGFPRDYLTLVLLSPQAIAVDAAGALYVTSQTALRQGQRIALGPNGAGPTFVAPSDDQYFTLLVVAP